MLWNLVKCIKPLAIVAAVVIWNALCLVGIWLNGGMGRITTFSSAAAIVFIGSSLAIFAFLAARPGTMQRAVLRPNVNPALVRPGLLFLGLMGTLMIFGGAFTAYSIVRGHT